MPHRSPVLPRKAFIVVLAIALAGCAEDDVTAPRPTIQSPGAPSLAATYTNGDVTITDLGTPANAYQGLALGINDLGVIVGHVRTTAHPPCATQLAQCNVGAIWSSHLASATLLSDPTGCGSGPDAGSVRAMNNLGVAVGIGTCLGSPRIQGYVRDPSGAIRRLPSLIGYDDGIAEDINEFGIAVGRAAIGYSGGYPIERAVMWNVSGQTVTVTNLGDPAGGYHSAAIAINNAGTVVGYASGFTGGFHAFVRAPGGPRVDIGTLPGDVHSLAAGITENGVVVGYSMSAGAVQRAFRWTSTTGMQALGTLGGTQTFARAANDDGMIVGRGTTSTGQTHAFAWKDGVMVDLGVLPGHTSSEALAINARGEIVGISCCTGTGVRAVRWTLGNPGTTPTGGDVSVQPTDETTGELAPVQVTFDNVTGGGETTVTSGTVGGTGSPPAPGSFRLGTPPTYYNVETTATFSGAITLCFSYSGANYGNEGILKLLHYENGTWTDVTTSLDAANDVICGSVTSLSPFLVAEENAAPVVTAIALPSAPVPVGTNVSVTASFTDANPSDAHTASISWDDGASALSVTESGGTGNASASHAYTVAGVYTVQVSVSDGDLGDTRSSSEDQPAYIVVYDPASSFVTGGGWMDSPVGACLWSGCAGDGTTLGRATFGFVSRYRNGASTPSGETEFQFKAGGLAFRSTSYQWLVVAGERAQYKGEGEIAGTTGAYGFLITAIDGALVGGGAVDRFRIKIWEKVSGAIVYDNKMGQAEDTGEATALGGGAIVIHK